MATIVTDLDVSIDLKMARPDHFDPTTIRAMFRELEFRSLLPRLEGLENKYGKTAPPQPGQQLSMFDQRPAKGATSKSPTNPSGAVETIIINSPETLDNLVTKLRKAEMIAFDTETTSTDQMQADLVGISLSIAPDSGYYIPVGHTQGEQLPIQTVLDALRGPFTDASISKAGHNIKYDFVMLARYGLRTAPLSFDTMISEWLVNPASRNLGLKIYPGYAWVIK